MPCLANSPTVIIPIHPVDGAKNSGGISQPFSTDKHKKLQRSRLWLRVGFFALFIFAPIFDIFRLDLHLGHFFLLGQPFTLGIDPEMVQTQGTWKAVENLLLRVMLPILSIAGIGIFAAWKWGRLYCGWLCPHFSMVEMINGLWRRTNNKPTIWERRPLPSVESNGHQYQAEAKNLFFLPFVILFFSLLWAIVLLTYLLPPAEIYSNLITAQLTHNQSVFIGVATVVFTIDFTVARHFFCRFGCAVGIVQSLAWFGNRKALVVGFERDRVAECSDCTQSCDNICPMRIKPRGGKGRIVTCTQCGACVQACADVKQGDPRGALLYWVSGDKAQEVANPAQVGISTPPKKSEP